MKSNCWEVIKCGREPGGKSHVEKGVCPVTVFTAADGFLGGENGGRACVFIVGSLAMDKTIGTCERANGDCFKCKFFKRLKKQYKRAFRLDLYRRYIENSQDRGSHI